MKVIRRKNQQNVEWQNERGFTLVEMLVAFTAFCMLMAFFPLGMKIVLNHEYLDERIQTLEWEVFSSQIKKEMRFCDIVDVRNNMLLLQKDGDTILYEKHGTNIRRRVNFTGHEIILQNVAILKFRPLPEGYSITVIDLDGNEFWSNVRAFIPIEVL